MTHQDYLALFHQITDELYELTSKKNKDYAESNDAFANFRQIEYLTNGRVTVADGILVRMTDKMKRIASLLQKDREVFVRGEKLEDTVRDLAVYSIILSIWLKSIELPKDTTTK